MSSRFILLIPYGSIMRLSEVKMEEDGYMEGDGRLSGYAYYKVLIRFKEFPKLWFKYETGDGMMTFDKSRLLEKQLQGEIESL